MRLNFACGNTRWPGFDNSDIHGAEGTSYLDLDSFPYPYEDESAEIIMVSHALFMGNHGVPLHPDLRSIFSECHRILKPYGWLRIDDNPLRCVRPGERFDAMQVADEESRGYPPEWRMQREDLVGLLLEVGFTGVAELDPSETAILFAQESIVGNHGSHLSFALEAQK